MVAEYQSMVRHQVDTNLCTAERGNIRDLRLDAVKCWEDGSKNRTLSPDMTITIWRMVSMATSSEHHIAHFRNMIGGECSNAETPNFSLSSSFTPFPNFPDTSKILLRKYCIIVYYQRWVCMESTAREEQGRHRVC